MTNAHNKKTSNLDNVTTLFFDVNETLLDIQPLKDVISKTLDNRKELADLWFVSLLHNSLVDTASWWLVLLCRNRQRRTHYAGSAA